MSRTNSDQRQHPRRAATAIEFSHQRVAREGEGSPKKRSARPPVVTFREAQSKRAA